jgi:hypothetical protein
VRVSPRDLLFIPGDMNHHFESFTDGLITWTIFNGSEGGEIGRRSETPPQRDLTPNVMHRFRGRIASWVVESGALAFHGLSAPRLRRPAGVAVRTNRRKVGCLAA